MQAKLPAQQNSVNVTLTQCCFGHSCRHSNYKAHSGTSLQHRANGELSKQEHYRLDVHVAPDNVIKQAPAMHLERVAAVASKEL